MNIKTCIWCSKLYTSNTFWLCRLLWIHGGQRIWINLLLLSSYATIEWDSRSGLPAEGEQQLPVNTSRCPPTTEVLCSDWAAQKEQVDQYINEYIRDQPGHQGALQSLGDGDRTEYWLIQSRMDWPRHKWMIWIHINAARFILAGFCHGVYFALHNSNRCSELLQQKAPSLASNATVATVKLFNLNLWTREQHQYAGILFSWH